MDLPPSVAARLDRLTADQRAAATAPPGPVLCIAPAGSGKTTTLVARIAWLIGSGVDPATIAAITFNARAAIELRGRLAEAIEPLGVGPDAVRVRTFHALGREILADGGERVEPLVDRVDLLRRIRPEADDAEVRRLDDALSRLKLDRGVTADAVRIDPTPGMLGRIFIAYEDAIAATGGLDFDDLVVRASRLLRGQPAVLARWRAACAHLLVDEVQDVDRTQLELVVHLSTPGHRLFLVGDDDQSIYGWRLADVRRVLALPATLPGLRRVDLTTNFRCPGSVVSAAVALVRNNRERFEKEVRARPMATGSVVLAPDAADESSRIDRIVAGWPNDDGTQAILARTNRELLPAVSVALDRRIPFRAADLPTWLDDAALDETLDVVDSIDGTPLLPALGALRRAANARGGDTPPVLDDLIAAAAAFRDSHRFVAAVRARRALLRELRRDDARLSLATAHATKGLEFDHVAVVGMEAGRFPSARAVADALEPSRALEEERRLAYVAWTRARRSLTLSFDPSNPSPFLVEAFGNRLDTIVSSATPRPRPAPRRVAGRTGRTVPPRSGRTGPG